MHPSKRGCMSSHEGAKYVVYSCSEDCDYDPFDLYALARKTLYCSLLVCILLPLRVSEAPDMDALDCHRLWEDCEAIGFSRPFSSNCQVENYVEWPIKGATS